MTGHPAEFFGEAEFRLADETYLLTINDFTLLEAEGVLRESMLVWAPQLKEALQAGRPPQMRHILALIYGGFKLNHPDMDQQFVLNIAMGRCGPEARNALAQTILTAMKGIDVPDVDVGDVGKSPPAGNRTQRRAAAKAGTGTGSSPSGAKRATTRKPSGAKRRGG